MAIDTVEASPLDTALDDAMGDLSLVHGMVDAIRVLSEIVEDHGGDTKMVFPLAQAIGACSLRASGLLAQADTKISAARRA